MQVAKAIAIAFAPEPHVVCGVRLLPLSFSHLFSLHRVGVSFVTGAPHELKDLLTAVVICAESYDTEFFDRVNTARFARDLSAWQYRLSGGLRARIRRFFRKPTSISDLIGFDFEQEVYKFESYFDQHGGSDRRMNEWSVPFTKSTQKRSDFSDDSPPFALLFEALISQCGFSESDAMNISLPKARWLIALNAVRRGATRIVDQSQASSEQREADEIMRKIESGEIKM